MTKMKVSDVEKLIAPAKADFLALIPQSRKLGYQEHGWHGFGHIYRVLLLSLIYYYNSGDSLSPEDKNILIYFSILHDIGRTDDEHDSSHGKIGVDKIKNENIKIKDLKLSKEGKEIAKLAIHYHCIPGSTEKIPREMEKKEMPEEHSKERAVKLFRICRNMDGLDMVRFRKRRPEVPKRLSRGYAKGMVDAATIIYDDRLAWKLAWKFRVERANIVKVTADAVVLPANETLTCTSEKGAFGAIFKAAGKEKLEQACKEALEDQGEERCAIGSAVVTPAFDLDADWIIHAVVPKWEGGEDEARSKLCSAYMSALALADQLECSSIAFPLLASGQKNFSKKLAIQAAVECFYQFQAKNLKKIILVLYDDHSVHTAKKLGYEVHETYSRPHKKGSHSPHKKGSHPKAGAQIAGGAKAAMKWLADPENQKMINACADDAMKALQQRIDSEKRACAQGGARRRKKQ